MGSGMRLESGCDRRLHCCREIPPLMVASVLQFPPAWKKKLEDERRS
jgi:hypothetical protein